MGMTVSSHELTHGPIVFPQRTACMHGLKLSSTDMNEMLPLVVGHGGALVDLTLLAKQRNNEIIPLVNTLSSSAVIVGHPSTLNDTHVALCAHVVRAGLTLLQPHWVYDSIEAGQRLPLAEYSLATAQIPRLDALLDAKDKPPHKGSSICVPPSTSPTTHVTPPLAKRAKTHDTATPNMASGDIETTDGPATTTNCTTTTTTDGHAHHNPGDDESGLEFLRNMFFVFDIPRTVLRRSNNPNGPTFQEGTSPENTMVQNLVAGLGAQVLAVTSEADAQTDGGTRSDAHGATPHYDPACTHVIVDTCEGEAYERGVRDGKHIVSCMWVDEIILRRQYFEPYHLVHRPLKGKLGSPVPECSGMYISFSG